MEGPPSRRANATLTPCPNGNHLWCIGGEFFSDDGKAVSHEHGAAWSFSPHRGYQYFYSDVFRYSPEKVSLPPMAYCSHRGLCDTLGSLQNEWRKFVSPTCPGPRSAHAVVATPAGGGKLYLFGA